MARGGRRQEATSSGSKADSIPQPSRCLTGSSPLGDAGARRRRSKTGRPPASPVGLISPSTNQGTTEGQARRRGRARRPRWHDTPPDADPPSPATPDTCSTNLRPRRARAPPGIHSPPRNTQGMPRRPGDSQGAATPGAPRGRGGGARTADPSRPCEPPPVPSHIAKKSSPESRARAGPRRLQPGGRHMQMTSQQRYHALPPTPAARVPLAKKWAGWCAPPMSQADRCFFQ